VDEQSGLAEAIEYEAVKSIRLQVVEGVDLPDDALATEQQLMLEQAIDEITAQAASADQTDWPTHVDKLDLCGMIGKVVPFLPSGAWKWIADELYPCLESIVGERLTCGMSDELLDEFGYFPEMNENGMTSWLAEHCPNYEQAKAFLKLCDDNPEADRRAIMSEYGAMQWLLLNRPDYPKVVQRATDDLIVALRNLVGELGKEALETWAKVHHGWVQLREHASEPHQYFIGLADFIDLTGGPEIECWASVEAELSNLHVRDFTRCTDGAR